MKPNDTIPETGEQMNPRKITGSLIASLSGVFLVVLAAILQQHHQTSILLSLTGLLAFIISQIISCKTKEQTQTRVARWMNYVAFAAVVINIGIFMSVGNQAVAKEKAAKEPVITDCIPKLKQGHGGWSNTYEEGSKYVPIAPSHYIYMWVDVTVSDNHLHATGYVYGKAYYVFWIRWGDVDLDLSTSITCEGRCVDDKNECKADFSTTGCSSRQESIVRGVLDNAGAISGNEVRITVAMSGSLSADGGPSIEVGKEPLKLSITWPDSSAENTFQAGTYKWKCECE